jgi:hypothetical protein
MTQDKLEKLVKSKFTSGYLAMDSKNLILWASLTALMISISIITYTTGYSHAQDDCKHTRSLIDNITSTAH